MELEKFARQLRLMEMLTHNFEFSIDEISQKLEMSPRIIYRYIDAFRMMGFIVKKHGSRRYRLDCNSPFFLRLTQNITFSEDEALVISQVLNSVYNNSIQIRYLREKLAHLYNTEVLAKHGVDNHIAQNISMLYQCIREERLAVLKNYNSPSSGVVKDRLVEPYLFINENNEVRCYEPASGMNKTFKLSRIESVKPLDLLWSYKSFHAPFHTDAFHFSGEERKPVSLILGQLATAVLLDECPDAQRQLKLLPDGRHRFDTEVCSYKGVGRFVLGLFEDIEIVDSPEFATYIAQQADALAEKFTKASPSKSKQASV